jgi:hypothetical protein
MRQRGLHPSNRTLLRAAVTLAGSPRPISPEPKRIAVGEKGEKAPLYLFGR